MQTSNGAHPASYSMGASGSFDGGGGGLKQLQSEADHSPLSNAKVKN